MMRADLPTTENKPPRPPPPSRKGLPKPRSPWTEARLLQNLILSRAAEEDIKPSDLAALARAWEVLEERKRILRGVPLPGSFQPSLDGSVPARWVQKLKQAKAARELAQSQAPIDLPAIAGPPPEAGEAKGIS